MAFENLTLREKEILQNLIDHYICTADPVGSRLIANKYKMGLSPATIRNTMQDLEEMGLISQPHTSAGRIPTDIGYRVFVDMLLKQEPLTAAEQREIKKIVASSKQGIDAVLGQTSKILGDITSQLGISIAPKFNKGVFRRIDLIPITDGKILAVITVESGLARSIILEIDTKINEKELFQIESILNERLSGLNLGQIQKSIAERLADTACNPKLLKILVDPNEKIWIDKDSKSIHLKGTDNLIAQPEFADREILTEFIKFIEEKKGLIDLVENQSIGEGIIITIGHENSMNEIQKCSLVTSKYKAGKLTGTIGIIGPTRMPYSKLISIVEYTARSLTEALSES
ncbi:MAG: heat-inducible transcriptional repressor HrcA [Candidatus Zixiibacteriota bacterium]